MTDSALRVAQTRASASRRRARRAVSSEGDGDFELAERRRVARAPRSACLYHRFGSKSASSPRWSASSTTASGAQNRRPRRADWGARARGRAGWSSSYAEPLSRLVISTSAATVGRRARGRALGRDDRGGGAQPEKAQRRGQIAVSSIRR